MPGNLLITIPSRMGADPKERSVLTQRRRAVAAEGLRLGARVASLCLLTYGVISLTLRDLGAAPGKMLFGAAFAMLMVWSVWHAFQPARRDRSWRSSWGRATFFTVALALLLALQTALTGTLNGPEPIAMVALLFGFAVLLPSPVIPGVTALLTTAAVYPVVVLASGTASPGDVQFAANIVTVGAGFSIALIILWVNEAIFLSRAHVLTRLERTADHDSLTGALNRRALAERLRREAERCERHGGSLGLLFVDVDRFKRFNHQHGYAAGDRMLQRVAATLKDVARGSSDGRVRPALARYGGEEFVVLLPDIDDDALTDVAEQVRLAVRALRVPWTDIELRTTASVGIARIGPDRKSALGALLSAADQALYRAKEAGGDRVIRAEIDDSGHDPEALERLMRPLALGRRAPLAPAGATNAHLVHLHHSVLQWLLGLTGFWLMLFVMLDLGSYIDSGDRAILERFIPLRFALALLLLATARLTTRLPSTRVVANTIHIGMLLLLMIFGVYGATLEGTHPAPYLATTVYALLTWALAMGAGTLIGFVTLCGVAIATPVLWLFLWPGQEPLPLSTLVVDGGVYLVAALVALAAQRQFSALRADEYRLRLELIERARVDALTGWRNRKGFFEQLDEEMGRASVGDSPLGLVVYDLDRFKRLNDTLGHLKGDEAIKQSVLAVESSLRATDTPGRLGGEEFALILPFASLSKAEWAAERLRREVEGVKLEGSDWPLSASFGVTTWDGEEDGHVLLARADRALRQAKATGRNRVVCLTSEGQEWTRAADDG